MSKAKITQIVSDDNSFISFKHSYLGIKDLSIHKHDQYELILVNSGINRIFVGAGIVEVCQGDLILIGSNTPHQNISDEKDLPKMDLLFFKKTIFPTKMEDIPDYAIVSKLLKKSQNGIVFREPCIYKIIQEYTCSLKSAKGIARVILLFQILNLLATAPSKVVSMLSFNENFSYYEASDPVVRIMNFLQKNYDKSIELSFLSNLVGLNKYTLCRHFKKRTGHTIFEVLQKIRLEKSCQLLLETNLPIVELAQLVGYNNLSVFNLQFKRRFNKTPKELRLAAKL